MQNMKMVEFTLAGPDSKRITLCLGAGNFAVLENARENGKPLSCTIADGVHNNGGWRVVGSMQEVITKMAASKNWF